MDPGSIHHAFSAPIHHEFSVPVRCEHNADSSTKEKKKKNTQDSGLLPFFADTILENKKTS